MNKDINRNLILKVTPKNTLSKVAGRFLTPLDFWHHVTMAL